MVFFFIMVFSTLRQKVGRKKRVEAGRQRVKLQLLISSAGESISTVFKCIIKEVLFATTGGRQRAAAEPRLQDCDKSYWQLFV